MKLRFTITTCILLCFTGFAVNAQFDLSATTVAIKNEIPVAETGAIKGQILTTDNKPAADVNVALKDLNRNTVTDENGYFVFHNVKTGHLNLPTVSAILFIQKNIISVLSGLRQ